MHKEQKNTQEKLMIRIRIRKMINKKRKMKD